MTFFVFHTTILLVDEKGAIMLNVGQGFYRFKVTLSDNNVDVDKNFFTAVSCEETRFGVFYKFKCLDNPKVMYKDGGRCAFDESMYGSVKPSGSSIYVILEDDNEDEAIKLVKRHLEDRIAGIKRNLYNAECSLNVLSEYENVNHGLSIM